MNHPTYFIHIVFDESNSQNLPKCPLVNSLRSVLVHRTKEAMERVMSQVRWCALQRFAVVVPVQTSSNLSVESIANEYCFSSRRLAF